MMATKISNAQWYPGGPANSNFAHLLYPGWPNDIHAVTIGDFDGASLLPKAFFHINTNLSTLPASGIASLGEVFRTDCPIDNSTYWCMLKGSIDATTEYGTLYSLNASDDFTAQDFHFYIQATFANDIKRDYGDIRFNSGSHNALGLGTPRMRILGSNGFVGIGDYTTFTPKSLLDVNGTITAKQIIISNENDTMDLLATIKSLQQQLTQLKEQITALKN